MDAMKGWYVTRSFVHTPGCTFKRGALLALDIQRGSGTEDVLVAFLEGGIKVELWYDSNRKCLNRFRALVASLDRIEEVLL